MTKIIFVKQFLCFRTLINHHFSTIWVRIWIPTDSSMCSHQKSKLYIFLSTSSEIIIQHNYQMYLIKILKCHLVGIIWQYSHLVLNSLHKDSYKKFGFLNRVW